MSSRRDFFKHYFKETKESLVQSVAEIAEQFRPTDNPTKHFFDSYEDSYSLTLAYPREFFEQMAGEAGIPHEGRETLDVVRDLHKKGII